MEKQQKYGIWFLLAFSVILFISYYKYVFSTNYYPELNKIETEFKRYNSNSKHYLNQIENHISSDKSLAEIPKINAPFHLHIYQKDSLVYWNTNKIPISKYTDLHFPTNGIFKGQNGWYFVTSKQVNDYTIAISFLIKNEYSYQNDYLKNNFATPFQSDFLSHISLDESIGFPIYSNSNQYVFSIVVNDYQPPTENQSLILATLMLVTIFLLFWIAVKLVLKKTTNKIWLYPISIVIIRWLSLHFGWFTFLNDTEIYKASLYGTNALFPNLFEYLINVILLFNLAYFYYKSLPNLPLIKKKFLLIVPLICVFAAWLGIIYLFKGLIENSSIPMHIEELFKLNSYSLIAILSMALLGFCFFIIGKTVVQLFKRNEVKWSLALFYTGLCGIFYLLLDLLWINEILVIALFPTCFLLLQIVLEYKDFKQKHLLLGMLLLAIYAFTCAISISEFNNRKEKSERELYANQLTIEKDIITEVEYNKLEQSLLNDKLLQRMISSEQKISLREFENAIERRHLSGFWERYECASNLFLEKGQSLLSIQGNPQEVQHNLEELISNHGQQSEINKSIYFIKDYTGQFSYIIRQRLSGKNGEYALLYITLKSKKIPEEIGFPRLLLSSNSSALKHLEHYSVAKYHRNKLVSKYGSFNYPSTLTALKNANPNKFSNFDYQGYNHFVNYKTKQDVVVLSGTNVNWINNATSFSYLFSIFGILLLPFYIRYYARNFSSRSLTLATKFQATLIGIVITSLLITGISSGIFVRNQYSEYSNLAFKQKIQSIGLELKPTTTKLSSISIQSNGAFLTYQLQSLSKIFNTDINIYDKDGFLVSTSRQTLFNLGLLSEQMNADALQELEELDQSEFIHMENIGTLHYNSSYAPLYSKNNVKLGYVNLQHFGQQEEAEHQLQQFFVSIINIFVFLIVISTVMAIFTANWITNPLQMLQELFSNIHLGKSNQRIEYTKNDEIGSLVKSYNEKIVELEIAAQQLAQSERESAWRDMAKQVAHEIKNPLTPMKLTVQHLMRSFDPNDPNAANRIEKVSNSLIEQIEVLTNIANEFSNFAKMPKPSFETIDVNQLIKNCVEIFKQSSEVEITTILPDIPFIKGDKEQIVRVFNNLIKNAIQAIPPNKKGAIEIETYKRSSNIFIYVRDNGIGMDDTQKGKIFTPYFTTKSTGTGIGLSMIKQIIENHNGSIYFKSTQEIGTTFTIELPIEHNEYSK